MGTVGSDQLWEVLLRGRGCDICWLCRMTYSPIVVLEEWVVYHRRRPARALQARSLSDAGGVWERLCAYPHGWWGHTVPSR